MKSTDGVIVFVRLCRYLNWIIDLWLTEYFIIYFNYIHYIVQIFIYLLLISKH